jgi:hypothetical protein
MNETWARAGLGRTAARNDVAARSTGGAQSLMSAVMIKRATEKNRRVVRPPLRR